MRRIGRTAAALGCSLAMAAMPAAAEKPAEVRRVGTTAAITARPGVASAASVRCEGGRALAWLPSAGVPLLVGPCDDEAAALPSGSTSGAPGAAAGAADPGHDAVDASGPADCLVPGYDDRCEAWAGPSYDGPLDGADYPGFGNFDRHTTVLAHPSADLVFVGGTSTSGSGTTADADFVEIAYRASTGVPVWSQTYAGPGERTLAYQTSIALSPGGETLYALGDAAEPVVYQYATVIVAFDALTGQRLWDRTYPFGINAIETALTTLPDGTVRERLYAAGTSSVTLGSGKKVPAATAAALDPRDGALLWTSPRAVESGSRFNELVVSPDGSTVYAAGGEHRPDNLAKNFATAAFRATDGAILWESRDTLTDPLGFYGNNGVSDMKLSPDGSRVLVTGLDPVAGASILDEDLGPILTVAHDAANGAQLWRKAYHGPVEGDPHFYFSLFQGMMGISRDGRTAVVTAALSSSGTGTVAYDVETGAQRWGIESNEAAHTYTFVNHLGYYPTVAVGADRVFVSNRRGFGYSQYRTVTMAHSLETGALAWTGRLGTGRTLLGGSTALGNKVFVTTADQLASVGFPVPDPGVDSVDILTVAYDDA